MTGARETAGRLFWFVGLWLAGVICLTVVAYLIRLLIK